MGKKVKNRKKVVLCRFGKSILTLGVVLLLANFCVLGVQASVSSSDIMNQATVSENDIVNGVQLEVSGFSAWAMPMTTEQITLSVNDGNDISDLLQSAVKNYKEIIIPAGNYYCPNVKLNNINAGVQDFILSNKPNLLLSIGSNLSVFFL